MPGLYTIKTWDRGNNSAWQQQQQRVARMAHFGLSVATSSRAARARYRRTLGHLARTALLKERCHH